MRACRRVSRSRAAGRLGRSRPSRGRLARCCRGRYLGGRLLFVLLVGRRGGGENQEVGTWEGHCDGNFLDDPFFFPFSFFVIV